MLTRFFYDVIYIVCAAQALCSTAGAQTITTVAGGYSIGYTGDNGPATSARLNAPWGVAADSAGNLFFADYNNNVVRKVATDGAITTVAGTATAGFSGDGGPAIAAQLNGPINVAVDKAGNLFIADAFNRRVRKVDAVTGVITTFAGNGIYGGVGDGGPATDAQLKLPNGIVADSAGNVYVADVSNNVIRVIDGAGVIATYAGNGGSGYSGDGGPATAAAIHSPWGLAMDRNGALYVAEYASACVRKISAAGIITTYAGRPTLSGFTGDGGPATAARLNGGGFLSIDSHGTLYISEVENNRIRRVDAASGVITSFAGNGVPGYNGDNIDASAAELFRPRGVATDWVGNLYVADEGNNRIRRIKIPLGIPSQQPGATLSVYPNPVTSGQCIILESGFRERAQATLFDMSGKAVFSTNVLLQDRTSLQVNVAPGLYVLQVSSAHTSHSGLLIVQ